MTDVIEAIYVEDEEQEGLVMRVGMRRQQINIIHIPDLSLERVGELRQPPYDVAAAVIFDAVLPSASGLDLARGLRVSGDSRPLFLLTAAENPDPDLLNSLHIEYMRKPANFQVLAEMIRASRH